ncbi:unnamed protein product [Penicillium salamii]|uniref:F-box domain-containing protein n=1 Tax=Penicillium salamii TaxID=1612424 RepID=A0A9W4JMZ8_9EURO|nr:unnamed protein product [Penicillium salamii]CAG8122689.1 unnamed protein product [Penicillium salamii]CAG8132371.1 unnamed protein product [Penicillium salamii]CAG8157612.1 unnamed protein product [Penicillium salamii]CAG8187043.1 unnamed protein product [Penicillium salamii]
METNIAQEIGQFKSLSHPLSRRKALDEIVESLTTNELREVRDRIFAVKFQRDVFGQLPVELRCLVASHLDVKDIFNLRRVSRLWKEVLSVPVLLTTVFKNRLGKWPAPDSSIAGLKSSLKMRGRIENGRPAALAYLPVQYRTDRMVIPDISSTSRVVYCKGMLAFTELDYIKVLNLRTGAEKSFTTENREESMSIEISARLFVAITRSDCYIWNIETDEQKSFPLPLVGSYQTLVNGNSVMLRHTSGEVVHFCFTSGMTRTIHLEHPVLNLSLHENGDFSTIDIPTDVEEFRHGYPLRAPEWTTHPLQAKRFSPDGDGFRSSSARPFTISAFLPSWVRELQIGNLSMIKSGQLCCDILLEEDEYLRQRFILRFTREDDDTIAAYWTPVKDTNWRGPRVNTAHEFITDQNIMYSYSPGADRLTLASGRFKVSSPLPGIAFYHFDNYQTLPDDGSEPMIPYFHHNEVSQWRGDDEFFVLQLSGLPGDTYVGSFNEDWKPAGLLTERVCV